MKAKDEEGMMVASWTFNGKINAFGDGYLLYGSLLPRNNRLEWGTRIASYQLQWR